MNIFRDRIRNSSVLFSGLLLLALGILLLVEMDLVSWILIAINRSVILILCIFQLVQFFLEPNPKKKPSHLWNGGFLLALNLLLWKIPAIQVAMIPFIYGLWAMIYALSKAIIYYVYRIDDVRPRLWPLIDAIISMGFAIVLLFDPVPSMLRLLTVAGIYLIYIGLFQTGSGLQLLTYGMLGKQLNGLFRIPLPNFLAMLYPQRVLKQLENLGVEHNLRYEPLKPNQLEILFHMKENKTDNLGHVDMIYQNKLYSYGAYDPDHRIWNRSLGDGVMIQSDPQRYMDFCFRDEKKRMVGFVYDMDDTQVKTFEAKLNALMERAIAWTPDFSDWQELPYIQRLSNATQASFFKFKKGYLRTYFAFGMNCVELVDHFLKDKNIGLFRLNGIITPGAYFDFLNTAYQLPNNKITQRRLY